MNSPLPLSSAISPRSLSAPDLTVGKLERPCGLPTGLAQTYRALSVGDAALLLAALIGVIVWLPDQPLPALAVLAVWAFGVIEFVN